MNNFHDKPIIFEKLLSKFLTLTEREKLTDVIFNFTQNFQNSLSVKFCFFLHLGIRNEKIFQI